MQFRHAKQSRDREFLRYEGPRLAISVLIFWAMSSMIPLYNKIVFDGVAGDEGFPFPLTTALLQLGFTALALTVGNVMFHWWGQLRSFSQDEDDLADERKSWICGPNFIFKAKITFPIGTLFGVKYAITNWGLKLLPLAPHLLLQSTDLMFTVIFAHLVNEERLTLVEFLTCILSTIGAFLVAFRTHQVIPNGLFAVLVNLASPMLLGLCVTTLRTATLRLLVQEARKSGKTPGMQAFEFTAIKLWWSCLVILPFAILVENAHLLPSGTSENTVVSEKGAMQVALTEKPALGLAALGGGVFILIFQVNISWMSKMATAVTVGVVGSLKIFPQWLVAIIASHELDTDPLNVLGAIILLIASLIWAWLRFDPIITDTNLEYKTKPQRTRSESIRRAERRALLSQASPTFTSSLPIVHRDENMEENLAYGSIEG